MLISPFSSDKTIGKGFAQWLRVVLAGTPESSMSFHMLLVIQSTGD
jgi:hypothetical protein